VTDAVAALVTLLKDRHPVVRYRAAGALGIMGVDAAPAVDDLVETLNDPNSDVRYAAVMALGEIGPEAKTAVPALLEAMREENLESKAKIAIGRIGEDGIPLLTARLDHPDAQVRRNIAWSLGQIYILKKKREKEER
jgi:HEAT repeat protein